MRTLVVGHYGGRNFGDELMLVGLLRLLRERKACEVRVLTPNGDVLPHLAGNGVRFAYPTSPRHVLGAIMWSESILLGGGTIFHDAYPDVRHRRYWKNLALIAAMFALARLLGRKTYLVGVGIGPLRRRSTKFFLTVLKLCAHGISVRDCQSLADLRTLPSRNGHVTLAGDLSLYADCLEVARREPATTAPVVGLSLVPPAVVSGTAPGGVDNLYVELADVLGESLRSGRVSQVVIFCANTGADSDLQAAEETAQQLGGAQIVRFNGDPQTFAARLAACDVVVASRYHVALTAERLEKPTLWLAYQRKVSDAALEAGVAEADRFDVAELASNPEARQTFLTRLRALIAHPSPTSSAGVRMRRMASPMDIIPLDSG